MNRNKEGKCYSLQYFYLGNPMDRRSLVGYSPWGHERVRHDLVTKQPQHLLNMVAEEIHVTHSMPNTQ